MWQGRKPAGGPQVEPYHFAHEFGSAGDLQVETPEVAKMQNLQRPERQGHEYR